MDEQQLRQHFAGQALTGILSSPRWSSTLLDMKDDEPRTNETKPPPNMSWGPWRV